MTINIALFGFGTVASGIPFLLKENGEKVTQTAKDQIVIQKVLVKDDAEKAALLAQGHQQNFVTDVDEILSDDTIDIVVELMGRIEPAKTFITRALEAGKHVVTANKDLIASHGQELIKIAQANKVALYYEAAVAGGIPILRTLANALASDKVTRVLGVLNGTSNFMLTKMVDEGWTYEAALEQAQALGYAESDPTNDVDGIDAAFKAVILSHFAFGMAVDFDKVSHKGIRTITPRDVAYAQKLGYVIKLVGDIKETASGLAAEVAPTFVPKNHPLANVNDVMNAVFVESIGIGESMYYGPGAGQKPTATSVLADIIRIAYRIKDNTVGKDFTEFSQETRLAQPEDIKNNYYFSISASNETNNLLSLTTLFDKEGILLHQVIQEEAGERNATFVILTQEVSQVQLANIRTSLEQAGFVLQNTFKVLGA